MSASLLAGARHEVKFVATSLRFEEIEAWVRAHPTCFRTAYPPRVVNNVYFDSYDLMAYEMNLSGASRRSKVRLRWYGPIEGADRSVLEVKLRRNRYGWKRSFAAGPVALPSETWRNVRRGLRAELPIEGRTWLDANPLPVLVNRYHRRYLISADGRVRVTLDRHQAVYDQRLRARPETRRRANLPDTMVVEFKFAPEDMERGAQAMQGIPLRVSRNSKYVIGVQAIIAS